MALNGKLVSKISINSNGDHLFELFRYKLTNLTNICPQIYQSVDLVAGQWGAVGCVFACNYTLDGRKKFIKAEYEGIDEKKKSITFKTVEGCVLEVYSSLKLSFAIECDGQQKAVKLSLEYEKRSACAPQPDALLALLTSVTNLLDLHYSLVPN